MTPLEFRLLSYLALHQVRIVSPTELLEHLYGDEDAKDANALEAVIARLRRKVWPGVIGTRRGVPEADLARMVQRGVRLDESGDGQGIGLAIVADIVEAAQGDLTLRNAAPGLQVEIRLARGLA